MIGYCTVTERKLRPVPQRDVLCGLPVLRLEITGGRWAQHRLHRGLKRMESAGVRRVLTPEDFPWWAQLRERGFVPPEPGELLRRLAPRLALSWLSSRGIPPRRAMVALEASEAALLRPAALALCSQVRGLVLTAPDGAQLERELWREFGAAALPRREAESADLRVCLTPGCAPGREPALELYPGCGLPPGLSLGAEGLPPPQVCRTDWLLCALWETGRLRLEQISLTFREQDGGERDCT